MSSLFQRLARRYIVPSATRSGGLRLVFDVEANGFLDTATAVHCIVVADLDSDQIDEYGLDRIADALAHLAHADYLTGHNITAYDLPLLRRIYDWTPPANTEIVDTLVAGRLILPNVGDIDDQIAAMGGGALKKLRGRYSVEAWGARLGVAKVGVGIEDFSAWSPELQARCVGDVKTTKTLWHFLQPDGYSAQALELEHRASAICNRIEADGVPFDDAAAERLEQRWSADCAKMEAALREQFPGMNPSSRLQVAKQLEARGWVPEERTEKTGQAKITDELLETIPQQYPEFASLADYHILKRRIAQLSKGKKAWRKNIGKDGRLHGGIVHIGTPHSRASHFGPNLAQVPNPKRGTPFATECRALFRAPEGWSFVACDQATLQDRTFAHYLTKFDNGAYATAFLAGVDQHWKGAIILDLIATGTARDEHNKVHTIAREGAKSFRYGFLFGAQKKRAGQIINKITRNIQHADPASDLYRKFFAGAARPSEDALTRVGRQALDKFEAGTPGLRRLRQALRSHAERHGWLFGLDGRRVPVRALHSTLNFVVTSAEAIVCKRWLVQVYDELCARFRYGWDGDVVVPLWIHDEIACCCRSEIAAEVGEIMVRHAKAAGEFYGLRVPLDADFKIGRNWANEPIQADSAEGPINATIEDLPQEAGVDDEIEDALELPPAYQIDWGAKLEQDFALRANPAAPPPNPSPPPSTRPQPDATEPSPARSGGNGYGSGNGFDHEHRTSGSKSEAERDTYAEDHAGEPFNDGYLLNRGYRLARVFDYTLPDGALINKQNRYELHAGITPTKKRPRKTFLPHRIVNGKDVLGAGDRRVIFNWPAIMRAGPDATIAVTEGESNAVALIKHGLLATTVLSHDWSPECVAALTGCHLLIFQDHDEDGEKLAADARKRLTPVAASIRIIPALYLWQHLPADKQNELQPGSDVQNWIELGGDPAKLFDICLKIPIDGALETVWASDIDMEAIDWLWPDRFALGKLGILAGLPDEGKSMLHCYIAACLTTPGIDWPNDEGTATVKGNVLLLTAEDDPADTVVPRLVAAGADRSKVKIIKMVRESQRKRMFNLASDLSHLEWVINDTGNVVAILIDPVTAYLGSGKKGTDSFRDTEVRAVLGPLVELAGKHKLAIIAIMHFNKKTDVTNALLRISNSLAFGGVARHVFSITKDNENARRLMARAKNNAAAETDNRTLAFHFDQRLVGTDWRDGRPITAPFVVWESGYVDVTATEALSAVNENKAPSEREDARSFLRDLLLSSQDRRAPQSEIEDAAGAEKISAKTLRRAKKDLKVRSEKDRSIKDGPWYWILPEENKWD